MPIFLISLYPSLCPKVTIPIRLYIPIFFVLYKSMSLGLNISMCLSSYLSIILCTYPYVSLCTYDPIIFSSMSLQAHIPIYVVIHYFKTDL